jgi:tRNA (guanine37-N1)-methyltransferase
VIGDESSALTDSYQDGLLAPPIYTRPAKYKGWNVPEILTSGDTPKVDAWRERKALEKTQRLRPDLLNED